MPIDAERAWEVASIVWVSHCACATRPGNCLHATIADRILAALEAGEEKEK